MITAAQLRAARALLGLDQRELAELSDLSVPTIQRMEASDGVIRCNVDSLMKLIGALDVAGIELISENALSTGGGRGVRLKDSTNAGMYSERIVQGANPRMAGR
jgi:transcriptional regulator with XRE-family HTH domain